MKETRNLFGAVAVIAMTVVLSGCWTYVDQGSVGVKINRTDGKIEAKPLGPGFHARMPVVTSIEEYPVKMFTYVLSRTSTEDKDQSNDKDNNEIGVNTVEGQHVDLDVAINFTIDPNSVPMLYRTFRSDIETITSTYIRQAVRASLNQTIGQDSLRRLLGPDKEAIRVLSEKVIQAKLLPYGFRVEQFAINGVRPDPAILAAISQQNQMKTGALTAQNALEKAKYEAEKKMIEAKATADANALLAQSMEKNPKLVDYKAIEKWDGHLPQITGGGTLPFINVGNK